MIAKIKLNKILCYAYSLILETSRNDYNARMNRYRARYNNNSRWKIV